MQSEKPFPFQADDLKMPGRLFKLRRTAAIRQAHKRTLDEAAIKLSQGALAVTRELIEQLEQTP